MSAMEHMDESETKKSLFLYEILIQNVDSLPSKAFLDIVLASKNTILALETVTLKNP